MTIYIGVDQSLAATGIAVVAKRTFFSGIMISPVEEVLHVECVLTEAMPDKMRKKLGVSKAEDDADRIESVAKAIVRAYKLAQNARGPGEAIRIACEAPSGSQDARAAKAMGMAFAIVRSVFLVLEVESGIVTAREAKEALVGNPDATKDEVVACAIDLHGDIVELWPAIETGKKSRKKRTKVEREAIADALAIARCVQGGA